MQTTHLTFRADQPITLADHLDTFPANGSLLTLQMDLAIKPARWHRSLPSVWIRLGEQQWRLTLEKQRTTQRLTLPLDAGQLDHPLILTLEGAVTDASVEATLSALPGLDDGPLLIVAPHPDDAEIAAGGLYSALASQTRIVTLSAGESLKAIERQYLPRLDREPRLACWRKGWLRSWNAVAVPELSGVAMEHSVVLGLPDTRGWSVIADNQPGETPLFPVAQARRFNPFALPGDTIERLTRESLASDLACLIDHWRPATVMVTDPELDPHMDHQAAALVTALALQCSTHQPWRILAYANHFREGGHPPGPAFQPAWTPPKTLRQPLYQCAHPLAWPMTLEQQRHKALLLQAMSDLGGWYSGRQQRRRDRREGFRTDFARQRDEYFQWAVRSTERFQWIETNDFIRAITTLDPLSVAGTSAAPRDCSRSSRAQ